MKLIVICIFILSFGVTLFFEFLRNRQLTKPVPEEAFDIYDETTYLKWKDYAIDSRKVKIANEVIEFLMILCLLMFNGLAVLFNAYSDWGLNTYWSNILTVLSVSSLFLVKAITFNAISIFKIDQKHEFNKTTIKTFVVDWIVKTIFGAIILGVLVFALDYAVTDAEYQTLGQSNIIVNSSFILILVLVVILRKIFFKFKPLPESPLKDRIKDYATKHKFRFKNVYSMNASKRSTRANAYFQGFGRFRKIVLYDTLLNSLTDDEILAVFAHEIGHAKHKDILKMLIITVPIFWVFAFLFTEIHQLTDLAYEFGFTSSNITLTMLVFLSVFAAMGLLVNLIRNPLIRSMEYRADKFSALTNNKEDMIAALKKIAKRNLNNLNPHPLDVFVHYSHPTIIQRIKAMNKLD